MAKPTASKSAESKRTYLKQSDVPAADLTEALRIPTAILDHYAGKATSPLHVAKALTIDPKGSQIKVLTGAAIAFGLIEGGAQAAAISVTDLARRILRPREENDDLLAKREAVLRPRVFGEFLRSYDGNSFPRQDIAINVLEEMGVPRDKSQEVLSRIENSAKSVGFVEVIKDKQYVSLQGVAQSIKEPEVTQGAQNGSPENGEHEIATPPSKEDLPSFLKPRPATSELGAAIANDDRRRRVFIRCGSDTPEQLAPAWLADRV